jgi:hydroxymethylpyrimidine pyrophosphatase-like HAD family hydrolase
MRYQVLAVDYDGTIARDGCVAASTIAALRRARRANLRLVLVTGRQVDDLLAVLPELDLFDRVVAENGALLYDPSTRTLRALAPPPPPELVDRLTALDVPFSTGRSIVATVEPHDHAVSSTIRDLGLEWHVIFNKGCVMALPSGVTKATGLAAALGELNVPAARTVAVGDAENDHAFMRECGVAVAVANALPEVKAEADLVTRGSDGDGVREVIDAILAGAVLERADRARRCGF